MDEPVCVVSRTIVAALLACTLASGAASAELFRCVAPGGRTLYSDSPCPEGSRQAREISAEVGACTTEDCVARRQAEAQAAFLRLQAEKAELARMQELRIRQEEAWARVLAARQAVAAAKAAYQPPREEYVIWGGYPTWFPHRLFLFRHRRDKCDFDPHCLRGAGPRMTPKPGGEVRQRLIPDRPGPRMRLAADR